MLIICHTERRNSIRKKIGPTHLLIANESSYMRLSVSLKMRLISCLLGEQLSRNCLGSAEHVVIIQERRDPNIPGSVYPQLNS